MHGGGAVLPAGDPRRAAIVAWIAGWRRAAPAAAAASRRGGTRRARAPAAPPPPRRPPRLRPPRATGGPAPPAGLPFGFMLNGRFDLDYERRQFTGNPFDDGERERAAQLPPLPLPVARHGRRSRAASRSRCSRCSSGRRTAACPALPAPRAADRRGRQDRRAVRRRSALSTRATAAWRASISRCCPSSGRWRARPRTCSSQRRALGAHRRSLRRARLRAAARRRRRSTCRTISRPTDDVEARRGEPPRRRLDGSLSAWYSAYYNPLGFGRRLFMQAIDVTSGGRAASRCSATSASAPASCAPTSRAAAPGVGGVGLRLLRLRRLPAAPLLPDRLALPAVPAGAAHLQQPPRA